MFWRFTSARYPQSRSDNASRSCAIARKTLNRRTASAIVWALRAWRRPGKTLSTSSKIRMNTSPSRIPTTQHGEGEQLIAEAALQPGERPPKNRIGRLASEPAGIGMLSKRF